MLQYIFSLPCQMVYPTMKPGGALLGCSGEFPTSVPCSSHRSTRPVALDIVIFYLNLGLLRPSKYYRTTISCIEVGSTVRYWVVLPYMYCSMCAPSPNLISDGTILMDDPLSTVLCTCPVPRWFTQRLAFSWFPWLFGTAVHVT